ncbi:MAG: response regulator transcription factor [Oscillospiraceae bacterium]
MKPILIVDDEKAIAELVAETLRYVGYECEIANDSERAADMIDCKEYDLALLDIMMPETDGYELLRYIEPLGIPVIFITAKGDMADKAKGLHMGADDYIVKPFDPIELIARVESVLRRCNRTHRVLSALDVSCDPETRCVVKAGEELVLTRKEIELLALLMRNKGAVLLREYLYGAVWGAEPETDTRTLDTHIQRLRRKLSWEKHIRTIYGVGYILEDNK